MTASILLCWVIRLLLIDFLGSNDNFINKSKKVKLSLIKHYAMKTCGGVDV
jgi:hypothetical protein